MELELSELAQRVGARLEGDGGIVVHGVAPLYRAGSGEVSFLADPRHCQELGDTRAAAIILTEELRPDCPVPVLICENPELAFARAAEAFSDWRPRPGGVDSSVRIDDSVDLDPSAYVGAHCTLEPGVVVGAGAQIGPGCFLGAGSAVGENTVLVARVSIYPGVSVGKRCIVHAGAVLGSDGFGLARDGARWVKLPQLGSLRVGDDVEVGANTTIDRGAMDDTVVEDGVKLDNQIHIGHNVSIGAHTAMAACVGIAGSTRIGRGCAIGGGSCIAGHIELCEGVQIAAMSGVSRSLREPGIYASGIAVEPVEKWRRNSARFRHLDKLARRVKALESRLASLGEDEDG